MQALKNPDFLKPGDTIGITCPAGYVSFERISNSVQVLQEWGFQVRVGKTVGLGTNYFAGSDTERSEDLQEMLDDPSIKAILMGRGGYGCSRIIDQLDFSNFLKQPKWICGFSDITVLHSHLQQVLGVSSLHSPMCAAFSPDSAASAHILSLKNALTGVSMNYQFQAHAGNRMGTASGIACGGNLAILAHLTGSVSQVDTNGKILLIEDIGEHLYNIDRLLLNLRRSGQLSGIKALIVGDFTDNQDTDRPFGQTVEEIVLDKVRDYDIPVAFGFPCGHDSVNYTLPLGIPITLEVSSSGIHISTSPKEIVFSR